MFEFLHSIDERYTRAMYDGNEPYRTGHKRQDGTYNSAWSTKYGDGETYNGEVVRFTFHLDKKRSIFICGDYLRIVDIRYSGKPDKWVYQSSGAIPKEGREHPLEQDRIDEMLNANIDCAAWRMVRDKAREIYESRG